MHTGMESLIKIKSKKEQLEVIRMLEKVDKDGARILAEELQDVLSLTEERK